VIIVQILDLDFDNLYNSLIVERKFIGILGTLLAVIAIWFEKKKLKNEK